MLSFLMHGGHRVLHSFPTRRSSDLTRVERPENAHHRGVRRVGPTVRRALTGIPTAGLGRRVEHRSEEHTSELQSRENLVCRLLLEKKKITYLVCQALNND